MRRVAGLLIFAAAVGAATVRADDSKRLLGSGGEVYTLQHGTFAELFPVDATGAGGSPVLALDVLRDGKLKRLLVPGTEGPSDEDATALAFDTVGNRVYVVWQADRIFNVIGFGAETWQAQAVELAGDPASTKRNPQLATSVVSFQRVAADGSRVSVSRTVLHLVWLDEAVSGSRLLYTAALIEGDAVIPGSEAFDLRVLAGDLPATDAIGPVPAALLQQPLVRRGSDGDTVGIGFVDNHRGELVTLELAPIDAGLLCFADKARAVIIDFGNQNPGLSRAELLNKARAVIIDFGHQVLHPVMADFLSARFLEDVGAADASVELSVAASAAWSRLIGDGIAFQQGGVVVNRQVLQLAAAQLDGSSRAVDLRRVTRRLLPTFPDLADLRLFLAPGAREASVAWNTPSAVRYRETNASGWEPVRSLWLGPNLQRDQAYRLVEQRLADH